MLHHNSFYHKKSHLDKNICSNYNLTKQVRSPRKITNRRLHNKQGEFTVHEQLYTHTEEDASATPQAGLCFRASGAHPVRYLPPPTWEYHHTHIAPGLNHIRREPHGVQHVHFAATLHTFAHCIDRQ